MTQGDPNKSYDRFVKLMVKYSPNLHSYLRPLLVSQDEVEDVAQEAALVAWRKFGELRDENAFCSWLLSIARFEALKLRRKAARSPLVFNDQLWGKLADKAEAVAENEDLQSRIQLHFEFCMSRLEASKREMLLKFYSPNIATKDIARMTGKSEQACYKMIQRLRAMLFECVTNAMAMENS